LYGAGRSGPARASSRWSVCRAGSWPDRLSGIGAAERGERQAVALDPGEFDGLADAQLVRRRAHDRRGDPEARLLLELDGGNRVRTSAVVDARGRRALVQQDQQVDGAVAGHGGGLDVPRPALGTHRSRRVVPVAAVDAAVRSQLLREPAAVVAGGVAVDDERGVAVDEV